MKKILILLLTLSLLCLCGCKNSQANDPSDDVNDPAQITDGNAEDAENTEPDNTVDWETPIDIDDAFQQETEDDTSVTEPVDEPEPTEADPTEAEPTSGQNDPTEPTPTVAPTEPPATKPSNGSGPIELPMVPG